jgi:phage-related baseplate assembly protein
MPLIPIDLLTQAPTVDEVFGNILDSLEAVGIPARSWRTGSVARSIVGIVALLYSQVYFLVAQAIAGNFLAFATGDFLTAHARDVYGIDRFQATFASAAAPMGVTLTNSSGAIYTEGADQIIVKSSSTGAQFSVSIPFTLNASSSLNVDVRAIVAGSGSSVAPGEIDTMVTPLTGVTVTNPFAIIGADAETDPALVLRCLAEKGTYSEFGPRDAYLSAALNATLSPGVPTTINRVAVTSFSSTGMVTVTCATPTGAPSSAELAAVVANIEAKARPDTVQVTVQAATPLATSRTITIWSKGGTASLIQSLAANSLAQMIANYPIGGQTKNGSSFWLFAENIEAAVSKVDPTIYAVDLSDPTDLSMGSAGNTNVAVDSSTIIVRVL